VIHKAESGAHALQACHKNTFTLVLMDVVMPVMDGIETTTRLLLPSFSSFANRPYVVGLNANVNPQDLDAFYKAGLSDLLLKPFNRDQLIGLIHQFLSNPVNRP
jgi:two-component system chemotaxis sensor kinase CheA